MNALKLIPSILDSDPSALERRLKRIQTLKDQRHIYCVQVDVVDQEFADTSSNNLPIRDVSERIATMNLNLDLHVMASSKKQIPNDWIAEFDRAQQLYSDQVLEMRLFLHVEGINDLQEDMITFKEFQIVSECWLVLNPETPISRIQNEVDGVMLMGVQPGASGRPFDPRTSEKVTELKEVHPDLPIMVDGGVSIETIGALVRAGATSFAIGSALDVGGPVKAFDALVEAAHS